MSSAHEKLLRRQEQALRDPIEVASFHPQAAGIENASLSFSADKGFIALLEKLKISLIVSREYEHLLICLRAEKGRLRQTFFPLPHPTGLAVDRSNNSLFVACTRNPNKLVELRIVSSLTDRKKNQVPSTGTKVLMPVREKFYPGSYYFHDLAMMNGQLYANTVGMNGIIAADFSEPGAEDIAWFPKSVQKANGKPDISANHLQLNSIAAGDSLSNSYFTASTPKPGRYKPGDVDFRVDKKGVVFSGKTREVCATGLTRPHSARLHKGRLWVANSGYGELGVVENGTFAAAIKLPGWTRGLCLHDNFAFTGISRVLPRFSHYAPGVDPAKAFCGIAAVDLKRGTIAGTLKWKLGNQVFGIEWIDSRITDGFLYEKAEGSTEHQKNFFFRYKT